MGELEAAGIQWHPGFYGAAELEFLSNKGELEFYPEFTLSKEPVRMDLLVIKKLTDVRTENELGHICVLSKNVREADVRGFVEKAKKLVEPGDRNNVDAVLQVSVSANKEIYEAIRRCDKVMCEAMRELMKEDLKEREQEALFKTIKNLMKNMKLTAEQAMSAMEIPEVDRAKYLAKL